MDTVITGLTQSPIIQYLSTSSEHLLERFINDLPDNKPIHSVRTIIQTSSTIFNSATDVSKIIDFDVPRSGSVLSMYLHMLHKNTVFSPNSDYKREHYELEIAASVDRVELICDERIIESIPGICLALKNLSSNEEAENTLMPKVRFEDSHTTGNFSSSYSMPDLFFINNSRSGSTGTLGGKNFHTLTPLLFSTFEYTKDSYNTNVMKPLKVRVHVRLRNLTQRLTVTGIVEHYTEEFDLRIRYLNLEKSVENNIRNINFPEHEVQNIYTTSFQELTPTKLLNCNSSVRRQRSNGDLVDYLTMKNHPYNLTDDDFSGIPSPTGTEILPKEREVAIFEIPPHFYFTDFLMVPFVSHEKQFGDDRPNGIFANGRAYDFVQYAYTVNEFTASLEANGKTLLRLRPEEIVFSQKSNSSLYDLTQYPETSRDDENALTFDSNTKTWVYDIDKAGNSRRADLYGLHFSFGIFGTDSFLNGGFDATHMTNARIVLRIKSPKYTVRNNYYSPGQLFTKYNEDPGSNDNPGKLLWKAFGKYSTITRIDGSNGSISRLNDF